MEFTLTERTEPFTLKEVLDFIDDTNISKKDAHELKSRIVDVVQDARNKAIDEFASKLIMHFADWKLSELHCVIVDTIDQAIEGINEIAEQMKEV